MEMCFARQGHAPFRHPNFQNWPNSFWLRAVLRATTERTFSASDLAKVVWEWCVLSILAWTCASRRNSVQVFVSHLATWLRTGCFSTYFAAFATFRTPVSSFFWLWLFLSSILLSSTPLFSLTLPISAFHLSILSEVWLENSLWHCTISLGLARSVGLTNCKVTFCHSPVDGDRCFGLQNACKNSLKYTLAPRQDTMQHVSICAWLFSSLLCQWSGPFSKACL